MSVRLGSIATVDFVVIGATDIQLHEKPMNGASWDALRRIDHDRQAVVL